MCLSGLANVVLSIRLINAGILKIKLQFLAKFKISLLSLFLWRSMKDFSGFRRHSEAFFTVCYGHLKKQLIDSVPYVLSGQSEETEVFYEISVVIGRYDDFAFFFTGAASMIILRMNVRNYTRFPVKPFENPLIF